MIQPTFFIIQLWFYFRLNQYITSSRNLMRLSDRESRKRNLKVGRLQVVSFLNDLPKTQHDPMSFTVDLTIYTVIFSNK